MMTTEQKLREAMRKVIDVAIEKTRHVYAGHCPDSTQPGMRDETCIACQAIMEAERTLAQPPAPEQQAPQPDPLERVTRLSEDMGLYPWQQAPQGNAQSVDCEKAGTWLDGHAQGIKDGMAMAVPQGWKLVPVEPTPEMIDAGHREYEKAMLGNRRDVVAAFLRRWKAMLAASPAAPEAASLSDLAKYQRPIPPDMGKILHENLWDLYGTGDAPEAAKPETERVELIEKLMAAAEWAAGMPNSDNWAPTENMLRRAAVFIATDPRAVERAHGIGKDQA